METSDSRVDVLRHVSGLNPLAEQQQKKKDRKKKDSSPKDAKPNIEETIEEQIENLLQEENKDGHIDFQA